MSIFDEVYSYRGELTMEERDLIVSFIEAPSYDSWRAAGDIIVCPQPRLTLRMAVQYVTGWRVWGVPDVFTVYRALRYAADQYRHHMRYTTEHEYES